MNDQRHYSGGESRSAAGDRSPWLIAIVVSIATFMVVLDTAIANVSLRYIAGSLAISVDESTWVVTTYLIANAVVLPISGWLSNVIGRKRFYMLCVAVFTFASLLCGLAGSLSALLLFRILQGIGGGGMPTSEQAMLADTFPPEKRPQAFALYGIAVIVAPTVGPTIGGWITDNYSWHWLFFINLIPGTFVAVVVPMLVRVDRPNLKLLRGADYPGMALMAMFLGCLEYTLEEGPRWDWFGDGTIRATAWTSGIAGIAFVWRSLTHPQPVVDLRALKSRNFSLGCFFSFVTGIGIFATIFLTPLFLDRVRGFSALQIGVAIFSTGVFQVLSIPIYTFCTRHIDLRWLMMVGLACFALGMWNFAPITHEWGWRELLLPQAFRGFAQLFAVAPTVTLTLGGLAPERLKLASGLFNLMRNLGGAIGIAACGTILNDRANLHFLRLAEHLNATNSAMLDLLQRVTAADTVKWGGDAVHGHAAALKQLWALTWREAQTQTYADAFLAMAACFVVATAMVPLMRKVVPPKAPTAEAH